MDAEEVLRVVIWHWTDGVDGGGSGGLLYAIVGGCLEGATRIDVKRSGPCRWKSCGRV